jgi:hypothetical protein
MPGLVPTVLRASLACALGVGTSGCGVGDEARARFEAFLADEPVPAEAPEEVPVAAESPAEPVVIARASTAGSGGEASGGTGDEASGGTGGEIGDGGPGDPGPADSTSDTGSLPMSYARPPDAAAAGATAGPPEKRPTPDPTPSSPAPPCFEGEWEAEDLHTYFRRDLTKQAHGRTVRHRGESGRHRLRFTAGVLHGRAEHRRMSFEARLANVDIRYTVDVHGEFEAMIRSESPDVLVVDRPTLDTLRVREVVRFSAEKSEARTLELPIEGRWQVGCTPASLELRPLEDGKPGPALRFVRPKP